jgi:hypothetical protein
MPDYSFENLDAKLFEHMAVALGQVHIARGLRPFGTGTDGGREATFEGRMDYPSATAPWDGYLVIQCKRKETRGATPKEEADWAIAQLDAEMEKYSSAVVPRRIPHYFLFVTNAELSAKPVDGGKDRFVARLAHWVRTLNIREADVWDREKLSRLLDSTQVVAQRFGLLHAGDVIHYAAQSILHHRRGIETTMSLYLQEELRGDQYVRLAQAGHVGDERTPLARVFVDLRATYEVGGDRKYLVVEAIQQISDRPVYPSLIEAERESTSKGNLLGSRAPSLVDPSRFVVVGGPGQGKSTLVQHLAQRHRAALLSRHASASLNYETNSMVRMIQESAKTEGIGLPSHPRFPFRIVLEQFADALAKKETDSVLDFIASMVRKRTGRPFDRDDAEQLLQQTPWFVAFDGLDEVPAVSNRAEVMAAVRLFNGEARAMDADLLVVATTRPQGYEDEFSPENFQHLYLAPLQKAEALNYAMKFVQAKYATDTDRRERVIKRLETAAAEEATARLMISPLQVTIMAALVDVVGNPPRERYPLFDRYYEVVYQREQERGIGSSEILAEYRADIDALHDQVGLLLQIATETAGRTQSRLSGERMRELAVERLRAVGYEGDELNRITHSLLEVALNRLVFIVPLEEDQYGFEVRSLQEFAAARALMRRGSPEQIKERLWAIAPVPYWRNTVLFAVGLVFAEREDLSDTIAQLCRELNEDEDPILFHARAGSRLALDILQDGVVDRRPKHRRSLMETALLLLDIPDTGVADQIAQLYRPEDEARYIAAARVAVSTRNGDGAGVFTCLAKLAAQDVEWATLLLYELWPAESERQRWAFEHVAHLLLWNDWQIEAATHLAAESSIHWVADHLGSHVPVRWIADSLEVRNDDDRIDIVVYDDNDAEGFTYFVARSSISEEALNRIAEAAPSHISWAPYIRCAQFILRPDADTLEQALTALVKLEDLMGMSLRGVPWPLAAILTHATSPDELDHCLSRARMRDFGGHAEWVAAVERWESSGVRTEDLTAFNDQEWPFNADIANRGIIPTNLSISHTEDRIIISIKLLSSAFGLASSISSKRARKNIADDLCFCLGADARAGNTTVADIGISQFLEVAINAKWWIDASAMTGALSGVTLREEDVSTLSLIGERFRLPGSGMSPDEVLDAHSLVVTIAANLNGKTSAEGIVRLFAGLAAAGASLPTIYVDAAHFTPQGHVALVALSLFSGGLPGLSPSEVARLAIELWSHTSTFTGEQELPRIVNGIAGQLPISDYVVQVLDALLRSHVMSREDSRTVLDALNTMIQYRTSNLGDAERQIALGLSA